MTVRKLLILLVLMFWAAFHPKQVFAGSLVNVKDTISTSRPSASSPISGNVVATDTSVVVWDNGSRWIASDSATLYGSTSEIITVASMSANGVPTANKRTLSFTNAAAQNHSNGSAIYSPMVAKHTINFTVGSVVPDNGKVQIYFPIGDTSNQASPSASGFSFNNIQSNNIAMSGPMVCSGWTITAATGLIQCDLSTGAAGSASMSITIGVSTPTLINPTKTAAAETTDTWSVTVKTTDNGGTVLDSTRVKIGTVDAIDVYATVEPAFTFTIAGIGSGLSVNTGNAVGCGNTEAINTGSSSTATEVNLGVLATNQINISAQLLTVTSNAVGGYSLTATSSGHLVDSSVGYWISSAQGTPTNNNLPVPAVMAVNTSAFGIHACGADVTGGTWGTGATGGGAGAKYANPSSTYYFTLSNASSGPISGTGGVGLTTVEYAASISGVVPSGNYHTAMTYIATPTF